MAVSIAAVRPRQHDAWYEDITAHAGIRMNKERVLVTGGSGFVGTNLVDYWHSHGAEVLSVDREPPRNHDHRQFWRQVDIRDDRELCQAFVDFSPSYVLHMAARTDLAGANLAEYDANTLGVSNTINACRRIKGLRRALFASSMLVCKLGYQPTSFEDYNPTTDYGRSKVRGERLVRNLASGHFSWVLVRPTSLWGPWFETPYRAFFDAIHNGRYFHPRGVRVRRSYGFVLNSVFQIMKLLEASDTMVRAKTFYLADYVPIELFHWATMIQQQLGAPSVKEAPLWLLKAGAYLGNALRRIGYEHPPLTTSRLSNLLTDANYDLMPLSDICGNLPYSTEDGVRLTVTWMKGAQRKPVVTGSAAA